MSQCYQPSIFDELTKFFNGCCPDSCQSDCCGRLSISEDEENIYIDALMAGVKSEDIKVTLDPKTRHLFISGEGKQSRDKVKVLLKGSLDYAYKIPLSNEVNLDGLIAAVSKEGILSITLSKNRGHKPLKIDVRPV